MGKWLSSSMRGSRVQGFPARSSRISWLSLNFMFLHFTSSFRYSSCSSLKTWLTKNCCSVSLAKLMHSCSKLHGGDKVKGFVHRAAGERCQEKETKSPDLFVLKFSKPKISSSPIDKKSDLTPSVKRL